MTSIETDIKPATPSRISRSRAQVTRRVRVVHDSALDRGALTQELVRHANVVAIHWEDIDTASVVFTATDDEVDEVIRRFRTISGISEVDRI